MGISREVLTRDIYGDEARVEGVTVNRIAEKESRGENVFGSTVGKGYYHHTGGPISMSGGGRRHNGPHNGHHNMTAMTIEYNGHHPPREPRKEESTLVRRSFRRSGDEWRSDSRRCV